MAKLTATHRKVIVLTLKDRGLEPAAGYDVFCDDIDDLLVVHADDIDMFNRMLDERGFASELKVLRKRVARWGLGYNVAFIWALHELPRPRPSDDSAYNAITGVLFEAAGCPVNGKQRRDLLREVLAGTTGIPPPYPPPWVRAEVLAEKPTEI